MEAELIDPENLYQKNVYKNNFKDGLKPDPILTVSQWADKYRILSQLSSAEPGPYRTSRTPFLKDIMDDLSTTSPIEEVVFEKASQVGGTECGNNWIGYIIDHAPGPIMSVMPRLEDAKKNSKIRIQPLIDSCDRLKNKVKEARSKDSGNTILLKEFPGGVYIGTGANSAAGLRSMPIRYLFLDEEDAYPGDVEGEGDPIELAKKRTTTFSAKKKIFHVSTPTIEGRSRIHANILLTDQRKYFVPCPHCNHMQWLKFSQLKWEWGKPETVRYHCEECEKKISNWQKTRMFAKGEWRATAKSTHERLRGYHLSGLYSPVGWLSWEELVREWEEARNSKNTEKLKTFINTRLGETWKDKGEAPEWKKIYDRREDYGFNSIPEGVCFLTAGADVQKDRIEVEIVGWGRNKRSHSIDYRVFYGDTSYVDSHPWKELMGILGEFWTTKGDVDLDIKILAVDSGYNTQIVYSWVRQFPMNRVVAIKGSDTQSVIVGHPKDVDIKLSNRRTKIRRALKLYTLGVSILKQELYGWLKMPMPEDDEPYPYGFCHFPEYEEEHFKQLTAEELQVKFTKGYKKYEWVKHYERNERLDCRVYARAAAALFGIDRFKEPKWDALESEAMVSLERQSSEKMPEFKNNSRKVIIKRRKSKFS